jgi:hypothetical protein
MAVKSVKTVTAILNPCVENHAALYDKLLELSNTDPVENPIISMVLGLLALLVQYKSTNTDAAVAG